MVSHIFTTYNVTIQVERREFLVRDKMEKRKESTGDGNYQKGMFVSYHWKA